MTRSFFFRWMQAGPAMAALVVLSGCLGSGGNRPSTLSGAASVGREKEAPPRQESALDAQLSGLHNQTASRQDVVENLRVKVAADEQQMQTALARDRSARPGVEEFELRTSISAELSKIAATTVAWQQTIDAHRAVLAKASNDPRREELQVQIEKLAEQSAEFLRLRDRLRAILTKLAQYLSQIQVATPE